MKKLNPKILKFLEKKLGVKEKTIRNNITRIAINNTRCTKNACAHIYAQENGYSVLRMLDEEDKVSLPPLNIEKINIQRKQKSKSSSKKVIQFIKFKSDNPFCISHIDEINRAYTSTCYTSVVILCRKVLENLIAEILRKKFPGNDLDSKKLYFNVHKNRIHDFGDLLTNLQNVSGKFGPDKKLVERIVKLLNEWKSDANDQTHSWYHIIKRKKEIDDMYIQEIFDLIHELQKS